jgi:hypothetical protein
VLEFESVDEGAALIFEDTLSDGPAGVYNFDEVVDCFVFRDSDSSPKDWSRRSLTS